MYPFQRLVLGGILVGILLGGIPAAAQGPGDLPVCPAPGVMCRDESVTWTPEQLLEEVGPLDPGEGGFVAADEGLTFAYRSLSAEVSAIIFGEVRMTRVGESNWWVLTVQFEGVDEALLTFGLVERSPSGSRFSYPFLTWRGPNAPPEPAVNEPLQGTLERSSFPSDALGETRPVHVYQPPGYDPSQTYPVIYMADGESLPEYVNGIDYLITQGRLPPLLMIGLESAPAEAARNVRGEEYVPGRNPERFAQHEVFFTQEVRAWAEERYGASSHRAERVIFGMSNGGLFAVEMTLRHPELYGAVLAFSAGASQGDYEPVITRDRLPLPLEVYGTAGSLDPLFGQTSRLAQAYSDAGAEVVFVERVAGHNDALWQVEFVSAVQWLFADEG